MTQLILLPHLFYRRSDCLLFNTASSANYAHYKFIKFLGLFNYNSTQEETPLPHAAHFRLAFGGAINCVLLIIRNDFKEESRESERRR